MRRPAYLALAALVLAASTGCSQVAQLRGVAGAEVTAIRMATNDVLVDQGIAIGVAPECTFVDPQYTCTGSTSSGEAITAQAQVRAEFGATTDEWGAYQPADIGLVIEVAGEEVFSGTVADVIARSGTVRP